MKNGNYRLGEIEKIIFESKLKPLIHANNGILYIRQEDIDNLSLNPEELMFIEKVLQKNNIIMGATDRKDRTTKVKDFEYGEKVKQFDIPKFSTIDEYGDLDQEKLIKKLDEEFIPNSVISKNKYNKDGELISEKSIPLFKILRLAVSDGEFDFIMNHLNELGIKVTGIDYTVQAAEFENYNYFRTYHNLKLNDTLSFEEQMNLFGEYKKTKDRDVLNKLFESNLRLAKFIAYKFSYLYGGDLNDTDISAQEGLFFAIQGFDNTKGYKFSSYAYECIKDYLLNNRKEIVYNPNKGLITSLLKVKLMVESSYGEKLEENSENYERMVDDIAGILYEQGYSDGERFKDINEFSLKNILNMENYLQLDPNSKDFSMQIEDPFDLVADKQRREMLLDVMDDALEEKEKTVLNMAFNFNGRSKDVKEIASKLEIDRAEVRQIQEKALRKLRHPNYSEKLKGFLSN